jgi:hypothetical protein
VKRFSNTCRAISDLDSRFPQASPLSLPGAGNANGLDRAAKYHRQNQKKKRRRCHEHNIQRNTRGHVLEDPALPSLPDGGRPAGGGHAQAASVLISARQAAGNFIDRFSPVLAASYAAVIIILYVPQALLGSWMYLKYRLYVRIPMEELRHWWTLGAFEFKEHIIAMGIGLLPAYWYLWRQPVSAEDAGVRKWLTVFLAVTVWYAFGAGHVANDFRGIGS